MKPVNVDDMAHERAIRLQEEEQRRVAEEYAWRMRNPIPYLIGRVAELEDRIATLERRLSSLAVRVDG